MKGQILATHTHPFSYLRAAHTRDLQTTFLGEMSSLILTWKKLTDHLNFSCSHWQLLYQWLLPEDPFVCFALCILCHLWSDIPSFKWCFRHLNSHWRQKNLLFSNFCAFEQKYNHIDFFQTTFFLFHLPLGKPNDSPISSSRCWLSQFRNLNSVTS